MNTIIEGLKRNLFEADPEVEARIGHGTELYRKGTAEVTVVDAEGRELPAAELRFRQLKHGFEFGCNGFMINQFDDPAKNEAHNERFAELFNLAVVPFYWSDTEPVDGRPRFDRDSPKCRRRPNTDEALDFCGRYGITPKGHPLMWHSFIPEWLRGNEGELKSRWERRVREIAERYGERIRNWDVVNEAVLFDPSNPQLPDGHVEFAFDIAMKHLPAADTLNYNDYACWGNLHGNYTPIYMLVKNLLLQGKKVDCLGLQYHLFGCRPEDMVAAWQNEKMNARTLYGSLDCYQKLGIPTNISEVTVTAHEAFGPERLDFQADVAERLYRIWFSHPSPTGIIYWNLVDDTAYVNPKHPQWNENIYRGGLLNNDAKLTPKPVYERLRRLIREEWRSEGTAMFRAGAPCRFRGFYGTYEVTVRTESGTVTREVLIERNRPNRVTLAI
ncbi:MAG: glycoside hydrolase family 10 [Lentisphaeria bacterium]|nr:glycoside hydrolase family 10 [Lentisphaeria bacterium]